MKNRRVGATDLVVSEVGFGCGGNAGLMLRGGFDEQQRIIAHALERGVSYFDTAPDYGAGAAEENLGRVLKALGARPAITTKVEIRAENLDDIAGHIQRSTEGSLRRLGRDAVDVLQIHNGPVATRPELKGGSYATLWLHDYLRPGGVLDGLERVLRDGKARYAGFICRGEDVQEARQLLQTGLFSLLNLPYTLLNPSAGLSPSTNFLAVPDYGNVIREAQASGAGIAVFSPLAGGLLTEASLDGRQTHPLARPKDTEALAANGALRKARDFQELAARFNISLVELAYRFILGHDGVSTILGGISSLDQLSQIVSASRAGPLPPPVLADIDRVWRR